MKPTIYLANFPQLNQILTSYSLEILVVSFHLSQSLLKTSQGWWGGKTKQGRLLVLFADIGSISQGEIAEMACHTYICSDRTIGGWGS